MGRNAILVTYGVPMGRPRAISEVVGLDIEARAAALAVRHRLWAWRHRREFRLVWDDLATTLLLAEAPVARVVVSRLEAVDAFGPTGPGHLGPEPLGFRGGHRGIELTFLGRGWGLDDVSSIGGLYTPDVEEGLQLVKAQSLALLQSIR